MRINFLPIILAYLLATIVFAQDLHFTQYYSTPLMTNPANTGRFKEDTRFTVIHRNQWSALNSAFTSTAFSTDMNFRSKRLKKDKIGAGLVFFHDNMGDGIIKSSAVYLTGAYHRMLDLQRRHRLSFGLQAGYNQKAIDDQYFKFPNQYPTFVYDPLVSNKESLSNLTYGFIDAQIGTHYTFVISEKTELNAGISLYQLRQPKESIYANSASSPNKLGTRWLSTVAITQKISEKISITPTLMYMRQSKGRDMNIGGYLTYNFKLAPIAQLYLGAFTRINDAGIALIGGRYKNFDLKFTYDATLSSARKIRGADGAGRGPVGAYEISINFYGFIPRNHPNDYTVPCGIF